MCVKWIDAGREPQCPPNPQYPDGIDVDTSRGADLSCVQELPYPAARCGAYIVTCEKCGQTVALTTAGRADDPKSVRVACLMMGRPL